MPFSPSCAEQKTRQRQRWRRLRGSLTEAARSHASSLICAQIASHELFQRARHVAGYLALPSEVNITPLLADAARVGKQVWVPRVTNKRMEFAAFDPESPLKVSTIGIRQPDAGAPVLAAEQLELVLLPLLAFTRSGLRLGLGGGYYDRSFSFMLQPGTARGPVLAGVAFSLQEAEQLPVESWDVPLHHIATQQEWIDCK